MLIDFIIGVVGLVAGLLLGYEWNSVLIFAAAIIVDFDIVVNELYRILIKREKSFRFNNLLDEYSYTHKFWFHNPLITLPVVFIAGFLYLDFVFGILVFFMVLFHFVHDTVDKNFDGVYWLWPFSSKSFKIRKTITMIEEFVLHGPAVAVKQTILEIKTRDELKEIASQKANKPRRVKEILKDNTIV